MLAAATEGADQASGWGSAMKKVFLATLAVVGLAAGYSLTEISMAVQRRNTARKTALDTTIKELKDMIKASRVTFPEAYERYVNNLLTSKSGATPIGQMAFARQLRINNL